MSEDVKAVSEQPVVPEELNNPAPEQAPGSATDLNERDAKRKAIEDKLDEVNEVVKPEVKEAPKTEVVEAKPESVVEDDDVKLKESIQKRINKEVAKRKTLEEQLAEKEAEIERLRRNPEAKTDTPQAEPTIEQCEAYIIHCRENGDVKNEVAAMRYLVKLEKEAALKEIRAEEEKKMAQVSQVTAKQQADWITLNRDYESENPEINLANQNSLLYKKAMKLYQDPALAEVYADSDRIAGFRKAVHDAHRYIVENGLHKKTVKEEIDTTPRTRPKAPVLAEPSASVGEDVVQSNTNMSDADKVKDEILNRRRNLFSKR